MRCIPVFIIILLSSIISTAQYIEFPLDTNKVTVDGSLQTSEWQHSANVVIAVNAIDSINVMYKHDNTAMYFAFAGKLQSANIIFPEVVIDGKNVSGNVWTAGQWWFHVSATDCENDGAYGIYNNCLAIQPDWTGGPNFTSGTSTDTVEMRILFAKVGFNIVSNDTMGIAFIGAGVGSTVPKVWPANAIVNIPNSWAKATFSKVYTNVNQIVAPLFSMYPNPVNDVLNIEGLQEYSSLSISDLTGRVIITQKISNNKEEVNTSALSQGLYLLLVTDKYGRGDSQLFYKQ